jgi:ankyrin repeat protein
MKYGLNLNLINREDKNALMYVCNKDQENDNNCETIKLLIKYGINPNIQDNDGNTALMIVCWDSKYKFAETLLNNAKNIDINMYDRRGKTALMHACMSRKNKNVEFIELLRKHGADFNKVDNDGFSALMYACISNKKSFVEVLLKYDSILNIKNNNLDNAINIALNYRCKMDIILKLIDYGADYQKKDSKGNSYLKYISERSDEDQKKFIEKINEINHYKMIFKDAMKKIKTNRTMKLLENNDDVISIMESLEIKMEMMKQVPLILRAVGNGNIYKT